MSDANPPSTPRAAPVLRLAVIAGPHKNMTVIWRRPGSYIIGRGPQTQLVLIHDLLTSVQHCRIEISENGCLLEDMGSRQGTFVNGKPVARTWLQGGDTIRIGMSTMSVSFVAAQSPTTTVSLREESRSAKPDVQPPAPATERADGFLAIPGYSITRKIGAGGMGVVYEAQRGEGGERVAIKTIIPTTGTPQQSIQLFRREMKVLAQLDHPRIVRFIDAGEFAGQIYLVMEYVEVVELEKVVQPLPPNRRLELYCGITCQVLEALQYAHDRKLVHRDVKPRNILIGRTQNRIAAKLADFGLAKNFEMAGLSQLTADHELRGTPAFMPQEQWQNSRYSKPTVDIYSTAATLFYYLTGCFPKPATRKKSLSQITSLFQFSNETPPDAAIDLGPLQRVEGVPAELVEVLQRGLAARPRQRFATAAEMRAALLPFTRSKTE